METHDVAVVGVGGLGASACYWAARRGLDVVGLEQFAPGHERGASQDHSRIIRRTHERHEGAALIDAAYATWRAIEAESGEPLLTVTGGLVIEDPAETPADGNAQTLDAYATVMRAHGFAFEELDAAEVTARWPAFRPAALRRP